MKRITLSVMAAALVFGCASKKTTENIEAHDSYAIEGSDPVYSYNEHDESPTVVAKSSHASEKRVEKRAPKKTVNKKAKKKKTRKSSGQ